MKKVILFSILIFGFWSHSSEAHLRMVKVTPSKSGGEISLITRAQREPVGLLENKMRATNIYEKRR